MEYLVTSNTRFDNGSFLCSMSFNEVVTEFIDTSLSDPFYIGEEDEEIDALLKKVSDLEVGQIYTHQFIMDDVMSFRRTK
jgi:hypothetical protein